MIDENLKSLGIICSCESLGTLQKISRTCPVHDPIACRAKAQELQNELAFRSMMVSEVVKLVLNCYFSMDAEKNAALQKRNKDVIENWKNQYVKTLETAIVILVTIAETLERQNDPK